MAKSKTDPMDAAEVPAVPSVKICGIRDETTLAGLLTLPVDQIGFVFAPSRRRVTPEQAGAWIKRVKAERGPARHRTVGVFVEPGRDELAAVLDRAPVDIVQLHSREPAEYCRWIKERFGVEVWRVVSFSAAPDDSAGASRPASIRSADTSNGLPNGRNANDTYPTDLYAAAAGPGEALKPFAGIADAILLDTYDPVTVGGSGRTFPWTAIPGYRAAAHRLGLKLIAAGGLTAANVRTLLDEYAPDGVDVSGGVETDGSKDWTKIKAFVERVKGHE